ncbi:MAG: type II toxin-antitoxin system VapC family toxin [Thermoleophilia bacterium]|jgi:uncharacterized protein|nr:type II toxin-antitoxin system VapC family toxin [Thermoleophilia bacterium]
MSAESVLYLDSSALVKLVVEEAESVALSRGLAGRGRVASCALARVEVPRAVRHHGPAAIHRARATLGAVDLVRLDDALLDEAASLDAGRLRSLDAIHVAAALAFGALLEALVTYDSRMAAAADSLGLPVASPR